MRRNFLVLCALIFAPTVANSASVDQLRDLDPTASYGVIWAPAELEEYSDVKAATEEINDINAFFDMEDAGMIVVASITRFNEQGSVLVYDSGFDAEEIGRPSMQVGRSCFEPIWFTVSSEGVTSRKVDVSGSKSSDVEYAPKCGSYPCTRMASGSSMLDWELSVTTDFFWRSNWNAFNYWTSQSNAAPGWRVSLYSGNSTINYLQRSCSQRYTWITLYWG